MASRKTKGAKKAKKKAKKKKSARTRSNPPGAVETEPPPPDLDDPRPIAPGYDDPGEPESNPPEDTPPEAAPIDPGVRMIRADDLIHALPDDVLQQLIDSDRAQEMIGADLDDQEEKQKEIDRLFGLVDGLDEKSRHECTFQVYRTKPLYHKGVRTEGLCDNFHPPFTLTDIKERFGGGTYEITLYMSGENKGQQRAAAERRTATVPINGEPVVYALHRDTDGAGAKLDPKIQGGIDKLNEKLAALEEKLTNREPKESAMDRLIDKFAPELFKRLLAPPPTPVVAEAPKQPSLLDQLKLMKELNVLAQDMAPKVVDSTGIEVSDDSALADALKGMKNVEGMAEILQTMLEKFGVKKLKPEKGASTEEAKRQRDESVRLLETFMDVAWVLLMDQNQTADTTADALHEFVKDNVPGIYTNWLKETLTFDRVVDFLRQKAGDDPNKLARLESDRGQKMVRSVVEKLSAKMNEAA